MRVESHNGAARYLGLRTPWEPNELSKRQSDLRRQVPGFKTLTHAEFRPRTSTPVTTLWDRATARGLSRRLGYFLRQLIEASSVVRRQAKAATGQAQGIVPKATNPVFRLTASDARCTFAPARRGAPHSQRGHGRTGARGEALRRRFRTTSGSGDRWHRTAASNNLMLRRYPYREQYPVSYHPRLWYEKPTPVAHSHEWC